MIRIEHKTLALVLGKCLSNGPTGQTDWFWPQKGTPEDLQSPAGHVLRHVLFRYLLSVF